MKLFKSLIASALALLTFASMAAPTMAADKMKMAPKKAPVAAAKKAPKAVPAGMTHRKGGYVKAHTFVKKNGTVVHVKGHYRKATLVKKPKK
jgi:hypothetical protein